MGLLDLPPDRPEKHELASSIPFVGSVGNSEGVLELHPQCPTGWVVFVRFPFARSILPLLWRAFSAWSLARLISWRCRSRVSFRMAKEEHRTSL